LIAAIVLVPTQSGGMERKMSKEDKKSGKRVNIIDIVIIILVLALIATVVYRIYNKLSDGTSGKQSNYVVTFDCADQYDSLVRYLSDGEEVFAVSDGTLLGYLYDSDTADGLSAVYVVTEAPDDELAELEPGEEKNTAEADSPDTVEQSKVYNKVTLSGSLRLAADATKAKNGEYYVINGQNITVGSEIQVYTNNAVFTISITEIEEVS
jgi:hypothetical protein